MEWGGIINLKNMKILQKLNSTNVPNSIYFK